jgi:acyl-CoA reductase-like NAD-dependent aldehyde dehydrogenase
MTKIISRNPSRNFEPTESVDISSFEEVIEKVNLAHEAQIGWGALTIAERIRILREIISLFGQKRDVLAMLMSTEMGMPISEAMKDMGMGMEYLEWYLDNGEKLLAPEITYEDEKSIHKVYYEPRGVVAVIVPWNFPFSNFIWQA